MFNVLGLQEMDGAMEGTRDQLIGLSAQRQELVFKVEELHNELEAEKRLTEEMTHILGQVQQDEYSQ